MTSPPEPLVQNSNDFTNREDSNQNASKTDLRLHCLSRPGVQNFRTFTFFFYLSRMSLKEEVDSLRVQASQDAATIHELRVSIDQEREGMIFKI